MKKFLPALVEGLVIVLLSIFVVMAAAALSSCRTCRQERESAEVNYLSVRDSLRNVLVRVDSINVLDSVFTMVKGDSVRIERWRREYRDRLRVDTVERVKLNTVYITRTERVTVTPKIPPWYSPERIVIFLICGFAGFLIGQLLIEVYWKYRRRK